MLSFFSQFLLRFSIILVIFYNFEGTSIPFFVITDIYSSCTPSLPDFCIQFEKIFPAQVVEIGRHVPGVIVVSALVEAMERGEEPADFVRALTPGSGRAVQG